MIDYISSHSKVLFVVASGNRTTSQTLTNYLGNGVTTISVGSIDSNGKLSNFSSYGVDSNFPNQLVKPTLVAPGRIKNIGAVPNSTGGLFDNHHHGTSLSAPIVTGIAAILLEEFPELKTKPWIIHSALTRTVDRVFGQNTFIDPKVGFGIPNYNSARSTLNKQDYMSIGIQSTDSVKVIDGPYIMPHSYIHVNAIVFGNGYDTLLSNNTGNIGSIRCTKIRISIYNKTNGNLLMSTTSSHNYYLLSYVANNTATEVILTEIKTERIRIFMGANRIYRINI